MVARWSGAINERITAVQNGKEGPVKSSCPSPCSYNTVPFADNLSSLGKMS